VCIGFDVRHADTVPVGVAVVGYELTMDETDAAHRRPPGLDDRTVEALGRLSEALETIERVRGHVYAVHQLTGHADLMLDDVVDGLRAAGHVDAAAQVETELVGRDVLPGRWTYQIVEEYDDGYYAAFRAVERRLRDELAGGRRHIYEAEMRARRQS
jgi:hypothetical protein